MTELEQDYCIKFCQKLGDSQVETIQKIQTAFGDDALDVTRIKEWYNRFKVRSNIKMMLTAFSQSRGVVHHEYAPQGQTITKEYYRNVPRRIRDAVRRRRTELWSTGNWRLHHDKCSSTFLALDSEFFWRNTRLLLFSWLITLLIWLPATSGC